MTPRLPKVTADLIPAKLAQLGQEGYMFKLYEQIVDENPFLWVLIEEVMTDKEVSDEYRRGYCKAAVQFYDLLKTQLEVDELEEQELLEELDDEWK